MSQRVRAYPCCPGKIPRSKAPFWTLDDRHRASINPGIYSRVKYIYQGRHRTRVLNDRLKNPRPMCGFTIKMNRHASKGTLGIRLRDKRTRTGQLVSPAPRYFVGPDRAGS